MNGIINVYKEKGFTSHDVVAKLRGILHMKKIGHTGTLDPDAVGVLPVCLGKGTGLCSMITDWTKTYEAVMLLGTVTDTQDTSGTVLKTREVNVTKRQILEVCSSFEGEYDQIPPMYSALKVNGKKLYELAREGKVIERKARPVKIRDIQILEIDLPKVRMEVSCSKGTYIRTLCHDIGEKLGCGGCMESLMRTRVSTFRIEDAKTLDEVETLKQEGKLAELLVPIDAMFPSYPKITVKDDWKAFAKNGNPLDLKMLKEACGQNEETQVRLYDESGKFIAIYQWKEKKSHIVKMFFNE